jgi:hypothetical protein
MRKRPPCGTALGYQSHLRHGEASCLPCREAHTERQRQRRAQIITCRECGQQAGQWARNRCVRCYERRRRDLARAAEPQWESR